VAAATVGSDEPTCFNIPPGQALQGKVASPPEYVPGACQPSGGVLNGDLEPIYFSTICCLP
jgi:hypothetical protein